MSLSDRLGPSGIRSESASSSLAIAQRFVISGRDLVTTGGLGTHGLAVQSLGTFGLSTRPKVPSDP